VTTLDAIRETVAGADAVVPVGGRTHWEVGGPAPVDGVEVVAPSGVLAYDPAELTITVGAGTTVADLDAAVGEGGQECPLDPRDPERATVGGTLATGLSGRRRLRYGPVRDRVLEVRFVTAAGRVVKGGGPTVKNVTGYDVPRLLVGSLGTIGVITQVTLRCQPLAQRTAWYLTDADPFEIRRRLFRPSCIAWDGTTTHVLLEGHPDDVAAEAQAADLGEEGSTPPRPEGPHRGRVSVRPGVVHEVASELDTIDGMRWLAEVGVGTVHVATDDVDGLLAARDAATGAGGWLMREAGGNGVDGFAAIPNHDLMARIRAAFDPERKLNPGRLPL
jgi:glycolate oxidase FAD binding subunit